MLTKQMHMRTCTDSYRMMANTWRCILIATFEHPLLAPLPPYTAQSSSSQNKMLSLSSLFVKFHLYSSRDTSLNGLFILSKNHRTHLLTSYHVTDSLAVENTSELQKTSKLGPVIVQFLSRNVSLGFTVTSNWCSFKVLPRDW